ncbi:MAG: sdhC, partial [Acidobacteriaceae bacterium]|nr:sdhC [Acidobacteriaceae bacterium]
MSTAAVELVKVKSPSFWGSTNGKKAVMAVTGAVMFIFVIGHLAGNLQVFEGPEKLNAYGKLLHDLGELLWPVRIVLLLCVTLHIIA